MKPDLSKARRAVICVAIKNDSGAILNGSASEIRSTPRLSLHGRTGFLFATLLEQFNLPCIETVVRCDDLYFPRLHARRDDRTGAL